MRIWDLPAGYLNRQSLLGEHRELHGIYIILSQGKAGYARHPETRRWHGALEGLACRHALLAAEMHLRGYADRSPMACATAVVWPTTFVTDPVDQVALLRGKYSGRESGRIALPQNTRQLFAQHRYSALARSRAIYRELDRMVALPRPRVSMSELLLELVGLLRQAPSPGGLVTAVEHMWERVRSHATAMERRQSEASPSEMLAVTQRLAVRRRQPSLSASTALSELGAFCAVDRLTVTGLRPVA